MKELKNNKLKEKKKLLDHRYGADAGATDGNKLISISEKMLYSDRKSIINSGDKRSKYTINPHNTFYTVWKGFIIISNFYTSLMYPYFTVNGLP